MTKQHATTQKPKHSYPRIHLIAAAVFSAFLVLGLTLLPSPDATATKTVRLKPAIGQATESPAQLAEQLADDALQEEPLLADAAPQRHWLEEKVRSGDTLSHIFKRVGLGSRDVYEVMQGKGDVDLLKKIHPGQVMRFAIEEQKLVALEYVISRTDSLMIEQADAGYQAKMQVKEMVPYTSYAEGTINSSLFLAAQKIRRAILPTDGIAHRCFHLADHQRQAVDIEHQVKIAVSRAGKLNLLADHEMIILRGIKID